MYKRKSYRRSFIADNLDGELASDEIDDVVITKTQ